ncbi:MAG: ABC transporter substrate-binding protein [Nitrososphaerales archaeon]|nr:ABC transporter substrate-binding protein [Nitrososphaerales archaeon]
MYNEILGREVEVPESPQRVVSFSPAVTETLFMIGLGDAIAGVSAFCARPAEARLKRRVGSYNTVSDELLAGMKPDLIFTVTGYQRDFAVRLSDKFPVYPLELPVSVGGIADLVVKVGLVAGAAERARELAGSLLRRLASLESGRALRSYVEMDLGGAVTFGAYSYITDAIRFLGSSTIFEGRGAEWLTPDQDEVRKEDPDVIFYEPKMFSSFGKQDLARLVEVRGWGSMRAVGEGNLFVTPGPLDFLAHHGPSFIMQGMPWLSDRLAEASTRI